MQTLLRTLHSHHSFDTMPKARLYLEVRISKFLGTLPYSNEFKFSNKWAIYSVIVVMVTLIIEMYRTVILIAETPKNLTVSIMRSIVKMKRISIIIIQIAATNNARQDFEDMMGTLSDPVGEELIHGKMFVYSLLSTVIYCAPRIVKECCRFLAVFPYFLWCTNEVSNFMIARQFCIITTIIQKRLSNITKMMLSPTCSSRLIESLCEKHDQCLAAAVKANDFYSLQLLLLCIYIFLKFLNLMVEIILDKQEIDEQVWLVVLSVFGNAFHALTLLVLLLTLAGSCENTKKKIKEFHSALFKRMSESSALRKNEWLNLYVEMSPTVEFTACDFFTISYSLVTSVIAAVSTYLVIIVQFNNGS